MKIFLDHRTSYHTRVRLVLFNSESIEEPLQLTACHGEGLAIRHGRPLKPTSF